ncbi:MAG: type II toxin-antitoxin system PemK/MazF family toxin [Cyanobacteria bacterium P01_F01_bin.143]
MVKRGEVYLINLDPTIGSEIKKTRPCVIVSPDEMNKYIRTVIIAPMTTKIRAYKSRVAVEFQDKQGQVMLDQLRTVDKKRLLKKLGNVSTKDMKKVLSLLQEMFTY